MANSERIHVNLATVGAAPSKKAMKAGPAKGKMKLDKGSKVKAGKAKTPIKKPGKKPGKKKP
tara:strand:+ start:379 stop:564 length:186 start_codon:yes stop_codon:yes gene_type:complete